MNQSDTIHERIRRVELYTRRLLSGALVGSSRSAQKGVGLDFDQLREYMAGDDPRIIDWLASARSQRLLVKQYQEERNRTILLVVDGSSSMEFGLEDKFKRAVWIASIIGMIGAYGADKVGLIVYTDTVELHIPPRTGIAHVRALLGDLYAYVPQKKATDVRSVLKLIGSKKERTMVFLISDCIDETLSIALRRMYRHDVLLVRCSDKREEYIPAFGILTVQDTESGVLHTVCLNSADSVVLSDSLQIRREAQDKIAKSAGIGILNSTEKESFIQDLLLTMRRRMRY